MNEDKNFVLNLRQDGLNEVCRNIGSLSEELYPAALPFLQCFCNPVPESGVVLVIRGSLGGIPDHYHGNIVLHILTGKLGFKLNDLVVDDFQRSADHFLIFGQGFDTIGSVTYYNIYGD